MVRNYVDCLDEPFLPFGYGLSYSKFIYSNFKISTYKVDINIEFDVLNDSSFDGYAVPQVYIKKLNGTVTPRLKELKAFQKVKISNHKIVKVKLHIPFEELKEWSYKKQYEIQCNQVEVSIGVSSNEILYNKIINLDF